MKGIQIMCIDLVRNQLKFAHFDMYTQKDRTSKLSNFTKLPKILEEIDQFLL